MIAELTNKVDLYTYYNVIKADTPYWFDVPFDIWYASMFEDSDCEGNVLFQELCTYVSIENGAINGFIQFGIPSFVFDNAGNKDFETKAGIIRNVYFGKDNEAIGRALIETAFSWFDKYKATCKCAFYHYFGMTCNAGHGKLYYSQLHIENLLSDYGFKKEHENVYFKRLLSRNEILRSDLAKIEYGTINEKGLCNFYIVVNGKRVGAGSFVYLPQGSICYLKWIYIEACYKGKGYGKAALHCLFFDLGQQGIKRIDTDTADNNIVAQGLYLSTGFADMGRTQSYEHPIKEL